MSHLLVTFSLLIANDQQVWLLPESMKVLWRNMAVFVAVNEGLLPSTKRVVCTWCAFVLEKEDLWVVIASCQ